MRKYLVLMVLSLITSVSLASSIAKVTCLLTTESDEEMVILESRHFTAAGNGAIFSYAGKEIRIYADTRDNQVFLSLKAPMSNFSGFNEIVYADFADDFTVRCSRD